MSAPLLQVNTVRDRSRATSSPKRVGRGRGSGLGKTSGRGSKGQLSRSGKSSMKLFEGGQMPIYRRLPKRGFSNSRFRRVCVHVSIDRLHQLIARGKIQDGETLDIDAFRRLGLIRPRYQGMVKLLSGEPLGIALQISVQLASQGAIAAVEKAGGRVELISHGRHPFRPSRYQAG